MNAPPFPLRIAPGTIAGALGLFFLGLNPFLQAKTDRHRVVWIEDPATRAVIGWNQASGDDPVVYYGPRDHGMDLEKYPHSLKPRRREDYMDMDSRFVYLENLAPGSVCHFVIQDSKGISPRFWFRTAPATPEPFTFIGGGDTKSESEARARGRLGNRLVAKLRPLFVLYCGDFTSGKGLDAGNWRNWLADWAEDTVSGDGRIYPIVPVRGNHESDPEILYRLFGLERAENYFAFTIGKDLLRVYVLNSLINPETPAFEAQREWLSGDLREHQDAKFKIAAYHKPLRPHTKGKRDNNHLYDAWAPAFFLYGVTLALEGDSHMHKITYPIRPDDGPDHFEDFIRDDDGGTVFIGEGSWGANVRSNDDDKPWTLQSASVTQIKWVHVYPDRIELRTVLTENAGEVDTILEEDLLGIPGNLLLLKTPQFGEKVNLPFRLNLAPEEAGAASGN